jgi:dCMP deaminase
VGSTIVGQNGKLISLGANRALPNLCKGNRGCLRVEKYGENSKLHRNPEDCRAIHSEIDAISQANCDLTDATIYVTRYPCEACARAIVAAGILTVVYGRETSISEETQHIFDSAEVEVIHAYKYVEEDVTT